MENGYVAEAQLQFVSDAVMAFAYALKVGCMRELHHMIVEYLLVYITHLYHIIR